MTPLPDWTEAHARHLAEGFKALMKKAKPGKVCFIRNPPPDVLHRLPSDDLFCEALETEGWRVFCVADHTDLRARTITSDRAVALREAKREAVLFLVDDRKAGPGMDGVYGAGTELREDELFDKACRSALRAVDETFRSVLKRALEPVRKRNLHRSGWFQFDFLARVVGRPEQWPEHLWLLGLWPCAASRLKSARRSADVDNILAEAKTMADALLGVGGLRLSPEARTAQAGVRAASPERLAALQAFLEEQKEQTTEEVLRRLRDRPDLWLGPLYLEPPDDRLDAIEVIGWRAVRGAQPLKWSGLRLDPTDQRLTWVIDPDDDETPPLTVKWRVRPATLAPHSVQYRVTVVDEADRTLAEREVAHGGRAEEKTVFTADDLTLDDADWATAKVVVEAEGRRAESESFVIRFGRLETAEFPRTAVRRVRTVGEALIELDDAAAAGAALEGLCDDKTNPDHVVFAVSRNRRFRIAAPALFREVVRLWCSRYAERIGRWRLTVHASGRWAAGVEFEPYSPPIETPLRPWHRVCRASRNLVEYLARKGWSGLCHGGSGPGAQAIDDYLDAWSEFLGVVNPQRPQDTPPSLAGTVEVCAANGRTIGLIVLPLHPLRLAWLAAYDALLFHTRWTEGASAEDVRREFQALDGAWFPAWLPGVGDAPAFVFAETFGLHAVAMTRADAAEPKADVLLLARALENRDRPDDEATPVGRRVVERLGAEIKAYADGHPYQRRLHIHALRAGDGCIIARALGWARAADSAPDEAASGDETASADVEPTPEKTPLAFTLELYAPAGGATVEGGFLDQMTLRRRARGRLAVPPEDRWMTEVELVGGVHPQPNFQWARRTTSQPDAPAHLGVAFDAFTAEVASAPRPRLRGDAWPFYGLLAGLIRTYRASPTPTWEAFPPDDEKIAEHPAGAVHTQRLRRLQRGVAAGWLTGQAPGASPVLRATLSPEKKAELERLHELCDWVVTFDRFAGVEYLEHPQAHPDAYAAYVIDYLPERDDLGDVRMVVSTALTAEVVELLGGLLNRAGLPEDAAAQFLLGRLKTLSRRLPIRLARAHPPAQELLALAYASACCAAADADDPYWASLRHGVFVPLDDVGDLLPPSGPKGRPERRADFLYVSLNAAGRLQVRFIEVKYRRNLTGFSTEGTQALLDEISAQVEDTRRRFHRRHLDDALPKSFRALRQAQLLRVVKSYADKAARRHLDPATYDALGAELDRAFCAGGDYWFELPEGADRGWVFCPTFGRARPLRLSPDGWPVPTFCFGPRCFGPRCFGPRAVEAKPDAAEGDPSPRDIPTAENGGVSRPKRPSVQSSPGDEGEPAEPVRTPEAVGTTDAPPDETSAADILLGYAPDGEGVRWRPAIEGNPHLLVAGLPGMGKTTCLINIARRMHEQRVCPIVFSYAPDFDEKLAASVGGVDFVDVGRLDFNPLEVTDDHTPRAYVHVAGAVRDIFAAVYPDLGELQLNALRRAIVESFEAAGWGDAKTGETPAFGDFVDRLRRTPRPDAGMRHLLARLDELADYGFFDAPPGTPRPSLWTRTRPVVVPLHRQRAATLQTGLATLVLYKLYKDMFRRGLASRITHAVIFDEAHRARRLGLLPTMAKECRKYGVSLVLASQEARDFDRSLFSAVGQQLVLRVNEADARTLTQNVAATGRLRGLADELKTLPKFHALYFGEGGRVVRCRLLAAPAAEA